MTMGKTNRVESQCNTPGVRTFSFSIEYESQTYTTEIKYTITDKGHRGWEIDITQNGCPIGYLKAQKPSTQSPTLITSIDKIIYRSRIPSPFNRVQGIMTTAQYVLNQFLFTQGITTIKNTIPHVRPESVLSRIRGCVDENEYPLSTVEIAPDGDYVVTTYLDKRMTAEEIERITSDLLSES